VNEAAVLARTHSALEGGMAQVFPDPSGRWCRASVVTVVYPPVDDRTAQLGVRSRMKPFVKKLLSSKRFGCRVVKVSESLK
jgi:hypothetical protein